MDYYSRRTQVINGNSVFATSEDHEGAEQVRAAIESAWGVQLHPYEASFSSLDYYATRRGAIVGNVEIKCRSHESTKHASVFLNLRKWFALYLAWVHTGTPSIYVIRFVDSIKWIDVREVDARRIRVGGCARIVKSPVDKEPVILIPVNSMRTLKDRRADHARA